MSVLRVGSVSALTANIYMPRNGVWHADLVLDTEIVPESPATLTSEGGGLDLRGTITRGGVHNGSVWLRIVGGSAGLANLVPSKFYKSVPVRIPLSDLLSEVEESLSANSDDAVVSRTLSVWTRLQAPAYVALAALVGADSWRVLPDGSVWVGKEIWPVINVPFDLIECDPGQGRCVVATEALTLLPGVVFNQRRVSALIHRIDSYRTRTEVFYER